MLSMITFPSLPAFEQWKPSHPGESTLDFKLLMAPRMWQVFLFMLIQYFWSLNPHSCLELLHR